MNSNLIKKTIRIRNTVFLPQKNVALSVYFTVIPEKKGLFDDCSCFDKSICPSVRLKALLSYLRQVCLPFSFAYFNSFCWHSNFHPLLYSKLKSKFYSSYVYFLTQIINEYNLNKVKERKDISYILVLGIKFGFTVKKKIISFFFEDLKLFIYSGVKKCEA